MFTRSFCFPYMAAYCASFDFPESKMCHHPINVSIPRGAPWFSLQKCDGSAGTENVASTQAISFLSSLRGRPLTCSGCSSSCYSLPPRWERRQAHFSDGRQNNLNIFPLLFFFYIVQLAHGASSTRRDFPESERNSENLWYVRWINFAFHCW